MEEEFFISPYAGILQITATSNWDLINLILNDYPEVKTLDFNFNSASFSPTIKENLPSLKKLLYDHNNIDKLNLSSVKSINIFVSVDFKNVLSHIKKMSIHLDYDFYLVKQLFQALKSVTFLTNLSLMNFNDYWHFLIPYLQETKSLKKLYISSQTTIILPKLSLFFETVKSSNITKLNLKGFRLTSDNIKILQWLIDNHLESFSFEFSQFENFEKILSFENCQRLRKLKWRLSENQSKCLSTLKNNSTITKLILPYRIFSNDFGNFNLIEKLQLSFDKNRATNYYQFCHEMGLLKYLRKLSMGDFPYSYFNLLINSCPQLTFLSISGSGTETSLDISSSLSIHQSLKTVKFNCDIFFDNVSKIIETNTTLENFYVRKFTDQISDVVTSLQKNTTLTHFGFIPDLYRKDIVRVLRRNQRINDFRKQKLWKLCLTKIDDQSSIPQIIIDQIDA
jgi:hypothetical protein